MADIRLEKLADLLVNYSVAVKPGDRVAIQGEVVATPLINAVYKSVLQSGGHPIVMPRSTDTLEMLYRYGSREQIEYVHEVQRIIMEKYDVRIVILGTENSKALSGVPSHKMVWHDQAYAGLMKTMMQRSAKGEFIWVIAPYPTSSMAQDAEMSLCDYEDFVYKACMPDMNDPVGYWKKVAAEQERIIKWLDGKQSVHITGRETDLRLSIAGRKFISCAGNMNMPDGEIFTGPVENSADGYVYFSYPAIEAGREVQGIRLAFKDGKVVQASAEKNEEFLLKTLDTDAGSRFLGEFAIGTNEGIQQFTREILFDEKIGGSFHVALGAGYPETGSVNESAIHWDMVCDLRQGGEITIDGTLMYRNGKFVI
ncbi:MAG: aminopeptidase [Dehalococcoidia bacterium]|nr:aminopeptidase [Dehalococcoidia bacterium]